MASKAATRQRMGVVFHLPEETLIPQDLQVFGVFLTSERPPSHPIRFDLDDEPVPLTGFDFQPGACWIRHPNAVEPMHAPVKGDDPTFEAVPLGTWGVCSTGQFKDLSELPLGRKTDEAGAGPMAGTCNPQPVYHA